MQVHAANLKVAILDAIKVGEIVNPESAYVAGLKSLLDALIKGEEIKVIY